MHSPRKELRQGHRHTRHYPHRHLLTQNNRRALLPDPVRRPMHIWEINPKHYHDTHRHDLHQSARYLNKEPQQLHLHSHHYSHHRPLKLNDQTPRLCDLIPRSSPGTWTNPWPNHGTRMRVPHQSDRCHTYMHPRSHLSTRRHSHPRPLKPNCQNTRVTDLIQRSSPGSLINPWPNHDKHMRVLHWSDHYHN